jgi:putative membrane protein
MVVVGATFGLVWEAGLLDTLSNRIFGGSLSGRGVFRSIAGAVFGQGSLSAGKVALTVGAFAAFLLLVRLVSMAWAMARLHGFTLSHRGADLRSDFGLFTRYAATIPIGRIQTLTIHEGPLHRLFGRASVRVDTAGGPGGGEDGGAKREWLAPIIRSDALPGFLHDVLPDVTLSAIQWRPPHPRAFARKLKINALLASVVSLSVVAILGVWDLLLLAILLAWAALHARQHVARLAHAIAGGAVLFRSGWIWRRTTIARFAKMQALAIHESPSDRHSRMASVRVDTAGAGDHSHRVHIPYLDITDAKALFASLSVQAARTEFRW